MKRNKFSLSHYKLLTMDMGKLIPLTWFEALPGDSIQQATSALVRVSPLLSPVMHPVRIRIHHWFVPNRLIWDDWEDFITGGPDGLDATDWPRISISSVANNDLHDYFGLPIGTYSPSMNVSALPARAYALIYNEHYRDQDIITELTVNTGNGADATTNTAVQNVAWEKDYFTTARPWTQKGADVAVPVGDEAPVKGIGWDSATVRTGPQAAREADGTTPNYAKYKSVYVAGQDLVYMEDDPDNTGYPNIYADLSQATGVTVNDLRLALAIQRYQEARAKYGSRYVEYLRYLGVRSSDARLQNPEYLGGGRQVIQFSEVLSSGGADDGANSPVGSLRGHGISAMRTNRYRRFFEEHGIVMTLMSVVPKAIYMDGMSRKWRRTTKEEYFQKELQFIGEQAIPHWEQNVFHSSRNDTFGYQGRYDEYRWEKSDIAGEFNSTLNYWHYARDFSGDTSLNQSFIDCVPTKRVNADTQSDVLYVMANHSVQARRMLTRYAKPKTF